SLLGIDIHRVPQISGGRGRRHRMAAIEPPGMIARILLIGKLSSAALPFQSYFVFGHVFYMECGQALGNRLFLAGERQAQTQTVRVSAALWCRFGGPTAKRTGRGLVAPPSSAVH